MFSSIVENRYPLNVFCPPSHFHYLQREHSDLRRRIPNHLHSSVRRIFISENSRKNLCPFHQIPDKSASSDEEEPDGTLLSSPQDGTFLCSRQDDAAQGSVPAPDLHRGAPGGAENHCPLLPADNLDLSENSFCVLLPETGYLLSLLNLIFTAFPPHAIYFHLPFRCFCGFCFRALSLHRSGLRFIFIVSDIDEAGADTLRIFFDVLQNGTAGDFIQISGALVKDKQSRLPQKNSGQGQPLPHSSGEIAPSLRRHSSLRHGL